MAKLKPIQHRARWTVQKQHRYAQPPPRHIRQVPGNEPEEEGGPPAGSGPPPPDPGGGGGGGGGPENWLGIPGLPQDVAAKIDQIFRQYPQDAERRAISYLMTTPWFATNYAGYAVGLQNGMFGDPFSGGLAQYRQYRNQVQTSFRQHYGREATQDELVGFINQGFDVNRVEQIGQGYTTMQAQQGDWQYLAGAFGGGQLTDAEKKAYGEELAGIDTTLGQQVKAKVEAALNKAQRVFQGTVGSSALSDAALSKGLQQKPDIGA